MTPDGQAIIDCLQAVAAERARRQADAALGQRVQAVKQWQHARFADLYAAELASARYGDAARFFLDDLYGPGDFSLRDQQFARIVPALVRLFPEPIVQTVLTLARLHALSERLDSAMGEQLATEGAGAKILDSALYGQAWRGVGEPAAREQQIVLMLAVGGALDRYTRNPLLRHSLRLMRAPAQAAGLGALQTFLERGFDTFRAMGGAQPFLDLIATRERALAARLFTGEPILEVRVALDAAAYPAP
jgi:hypothetical protein